MIDRHTQSIA